MDEDIVTWTVNLDMVVFIIFVFPGQVIVFKGSQSIERGFGFDSLAPRGLVVTFFDEKEWSTVDRLPLLQKATKRQSH